MGELDLTRARAEAERQIAETLRGSPSFMRAVDDLNQRAVAGDQSVAALACAAGAAIGVETVRLADGEAHQALVPGVEPVTLASREIATLRARRASRRGDAPLPAGGLFDSVARDQLELF